MQKHRYQAIRLHRYIICHIIKSMRQQNKINFPGMNNDDDGEPFVLR